MPVQHTSLRQEKVSDAAREQNKLRFKHISFYYRDIELEKKITVQPHACIMHTCFGCVHINYLCKIV